MHPAVRLGVDKAKSPTSTGKVDVLDMELIQSQEKFRHLSQASVIQHLLHNSKQNRKQEDGKKEKFCNSFTFLPFRFAMYPKRRCH